MEPLTDRQQRVLRFVEEFVRRHGYAPSVREIASGLRIGTPKGAADHLTTLERKGYIRRQAGKPRSIRLLHQESGIPILGRVAAGLPILAEENLEGRLPLPQDAFGRGELFAVRVRGDSMTGDHILDGDVAVVRRQPTVTNGAIAAVLLEDEATLKHFHHKRDRVELRSSNPAYRPIVCRGGELRILGKMVGLVRTAAT